MAARPDHLGHPPAIQIERRTPTENIVPGQFAMQRIVIPVGSDLGEHNVDEVLSPEIGGTGDVMARPIAGRAAQVRGRGGIA
ncbi:hypothetical protein LTT66_00765 [Nocardia gipuzkoensis]|uniref:hypothetical protein n=1 Tax=Nocardia gipuzkoensis TaxID=2749991 RepID=UPI001E4595BB|nr:hypothetical protein [Nocardia gipuzkoensis]UGT68804.1 hypothetical protein LTT66_00765 [Nocardia gipuzkoensis]